MSADHDSKRGTFLTFLLAGTAGLFFLSFMVLIMGRFFVFFGLVVGGIVLMGWLHYALWGKLLTDRTAGEREEHQLLERMREEEIDKKRGSER
jgi:hypothetical protein